MLITAGPRPVTAPGPPVSRGPLSIAMLKALYGSRAVPSVANIGSAAVEEADPYGEDLQLALYCCYELHCRGFAGSPMIWSGEPGLLGLRRQLEQAFLTALRADVRGGTDVAAEINTLLIGVRPECARKGPRLFQWFL
jgi:hypothetical protein